MLKQEVAEIRQEAVIREERSRADELAKEELQLARDKVQVEIKAKHKQQKLEAKTRVHLAHME